MATCDFVPSPCAALAIQACFKSFECALESLGFSDVEERVNSGPTLTAEARTTLDGSTQCLIDALTAAFATAGCAFPPLPPAPAAPDLTACLDQLQQVKDQIEDPLAFLGDLIQIEFDDDMKPTRIVICP